MDNATDNDAFIPLAPWLEPLGLTMRDLAEVERRFRVTLPIKIEVSDNELVASIWRGGLWETLMFCEMAGLLPQQRPTAAAASSAPTSAAPDLREPST